MPLVLPGLLPGAVEMPGGDMSIPAGGPDRDRHSVSFAWELFLKSEGTTDAAGCFM